MAGIPRQLIESTEFTEQLTKLGKAKSVDHALSALTWAISNNAEDYPVVTGLAPLRAAKTNAISWLKLGPILVIFRIKDAERVDLLWIEEIDFAE